MIMSNFNLSDFLDALKESAEEEQLTDGEVFTKFLLELEGAFSKRRELEEVLTKTEAMKVKIETGVSAKILERNLKNESERRASIKSVLFTRTDYNSIVDKLNALRNQLCKVNDFIVVLRYYIRFITVHKDTYNKGVASFIVGARGTRHLVLEEDDEDSLDFKRE
jgi:hypothetical protein